MRNLFTSESVGAGHPDKICDTISDRILDECLRQDKESRVACEVMASNRLIVIGGEITTKAYVDVVKVAWDVLLGLGYEESDFTIISNINKQSPDINQGVDKDNEIGAGDQGIMFGYATNETKELMPLPIMIAHKIMEELGKEIKKSYGTLGDMCKTDMKAQVTIDYSNNNKKIDTILVSMQHKDWIDSEELKPFVEKFVRELVSSEFDLNSEYNFLFNPTGQFIIGGPIGDTGLTGRKIIVDTYGGKGRHGGGAFSGKDYTKVDRSGAYAARWVAKHVLHALVHANDVEIQLSYAIGVAKPISINVVVDGEQENRVANIVNGMFDLTPTGIIKTLNLKEPIYSKTTNYGHFGKKDLPWEIIDWKLVKKIREMYYE